MKAKATESAFAAAFFVLAAVFLASCAGGPEPTAAWRGEVPGNHGSWTLAVQEDATARFAWNRLPQAVLAGEMFAEDGGAWTFHVDRVLWFEKWSHGWTEADFAAYGSLRLTPKDGGWSVEVLEEPVIESVRWAQMRHWDDGYYDERARDLAERRWLRSRAVADHFLEAWDGEEICEWKAFRDRYRAELLPEAYDRKSPAAAAAGESGEWAEGVVWNTAYTTEQFPEALHEVRNSGTLYRDAREGGAMVYLAYAWPAAWTSLIPSSTIEERKDQ